MMNLSFHDVETLSAYLDNQLPQAKKSRLEIRLKSEAGLIPVLEELRQARHLLQHTPRRRSPRNFTLTPKMAGIKPPVPRLVPAFSWASAVAVLLFVFTLGSSLLGRLSFGAAAPMMASAPSGYGVGGGPSEEEMATEPQAGDSAYLTATPETFVMAVPEATPAPEAREVPPADAGQPKVQQPFNAWLVIWPGLAVVSIAAALTLRWAGIRAFRRKNLPK